MIMTASALSLLSLSPPLYAAVSTAVDAADAEPKEPTDEEMSGSYTVRRKRRGPPVGWARFLLI